MRFGRSSSSACRPNPVTVVVVTTALEFVRSLAHSGWSGCSAGSSCCISTETSPSPLESSVTGSGLSKTLIDAGLIQTLVNTRLDEALIDTRVEALLLTVCSALLMLEKLTFAVSLGSRDMRLDASGDWGNGLGTMSE
jgi:hypothetical protein